MRDTKDMMLRLPPGLWRQAQMHKIDTGESINALVTRLLTDYFTAAETPKKSPKKLSKNNQ